MVNKLAKGVRGLVGDDVVNELMAVAEKQRGLLPQTGRAAHEAFQRREFEALQGKVFGKELTNYLAKVPPEPRAKISAWMSRLRDADDRAKALVEEEWRKIKGLGREGLNFLAELMARAQEARDEL